MRVADLVATGKKVGQAVLEFTAKSLTGFAGLVPFHEFVSRLGVEELVNQRLRLKRVGDVYSNGRMVVALVYGFVVGLLRLRDVALLRLDRVLLKALGWASSPAQSTLSLFLRKFDAKAVISLGEVCLELLERFRKEWEGVRKVHLDLDSHVRTVFGETLEGAERGYNPNRRGRRSYHPLAAFVGETRDFLHGMFRPGNTTTTGMVDFLRECLRALFRVLGGRFVRICIRADSGFCFDEFLTTVEEMAKEDGGPEIDYIIALRMYPHHQCRFAGLEFRAMDDGTECAEYLSTDWPGKKERRIVVIRQPVPDKSSGKRVAGKQLQLFELQGYAYRAFVTSSTAAPEEVWREYNGRACCENYIKEAIDFGLDVNASRSYQANAAHFLMVMMAYNLQNWYKEVGLGLPQPGSDEETAREKAQDDDGGRAARPATREAGRRRRRGSSEKPMSKWVRWRLFWVPGVLVCSARQLRLKLPKDWPWRGLLAQLVTRVLAWQPAAVT